MESFKIENIDIPTIDFKVNPKLDDGVLELKTEIMGRIITELIDFKTEAIKCALVSLGWTPPTLHKCDGDHTEITPCIDPECWLL